MGFLRLRKPWIRIRDTASESEVVLCWVNMRSVTVWEKRLSWTQIWKKWISTQTKYATLRFTHVKKQGSNSVCKQLPEAGSFRTGSHSVKKPSHPLRSEFSSPCSHRPELGTVPSQLDVANNRLFVPILILILNYRSEIQKETFDHYTSSYK